MIYIKSLILKNFRTYKKAELTFSPKTNLLFGKNGEGKTNILEAIHLLLYGSSFRTRKLTDLISFGENYFQIEALFEKFGVEQSIQLSYSAKERKIIHNTTSLNSVRKLLGILHGVFLLPKDKLLIEGAPEERRLYLDLQLSQLDPLYLEHLNRYYLAMKHRNCLLKEKKLEGIECFEQIMAQSATFLTNKRACLLKDIEWLIKDIHSHLSKDPLAIHFEAAKEFSPSFYFEQLKKSRQKDLLFGYTGFGPHRDDFILLLQNHEAKQFASEGQKSSLAATLKLASWERLKKELQLKPLMAIDDIGVSLDTHRKKELVTLTGKLGQLFITSADPKESFELLEGSKSYFIAGGSCFDQS